MYFHADVAESRQSQEEPVVKFYFKPVVEIPATNVF